MIRPAGSDVRIEAPGELTGGGKIRRARPGDCPRQHKADLVNRIAAAWTERREYYARPGAEMGAPHRRQLSHETARPTLG